MAATPQLRDRLSFLHRLPILLKGTADDDVPCPGYLFEEIAKISHESLGSSQCLLEYLLSRLHSGSGRVKLKVLKIMLHLCSHGSQSFLLILQRNPAFIQEAAGLLPGALVNLPLSKGCGRTGLVRPSGEVGLWPVVIQATGGSGVESHPGWRGGTELRLPMQGGGLQATPLEVVHRAQLGSPLSASSAVFTGPPDPLHGNSLYQRVRAAAQDLGAALVPGVRTAPRRATDAGVTAGMGSQSRPQSALQGFGYSKERGHTGSAGESFLSTIQKAAEVVASAVRPGPESPSTQRPLLRGNAYQPAVTPPASLSPPTPGNPLPVAGLGARAVRRQPGQAGGGWDELDSSPSSQGSSQEDGALGGASDSSSRSGSDSPSVTSRAPSDLAERVEAMTPGDHQQELSLVRAVTRGPHAFLSREEVPPCRCGLLNCEAVLELLIRHLGGTGEHEQMRALGAIASLGCTDLLSQERVLLLARPRLRELSAGHPGPVTNKATKILRHFEASCQQWPPARKPPAEPGPTAAHVSPSDLLTDALPLAGDQAFLQPLSSALFTPRSTAPPSGLHPGPVSPTPQDGCLLPAPGDAVETETRLAASTEQGLGSERGPVGMDTRQWGPELGPGPSGSSHSLFAGMELVACPRLVAAGPAVGEPRQAPWTLSQRMAAKKPSGSEPSAFAFLNS
ncbi:AP-4 complex accessory subunit Tepsin [Camelus dromedarius]|uniref:AP-4 complex accessory subunit Tepsin n=1 Tax=Camelus dromedarius TaxID=9838 RepID=A0A5N4D571_CAMDR|nr:AP-4 complex accessory subunit Tepsin [Camelus dromedarius]